MPSEGETGKLLSEILHHVIAFEFAVNQHIKPDLFLPTHGARRLLLQERSILRIA